MKRRLIVAAALVLVWAVVVCYMPSKEPVRDPRVEQLQAESKQLQAESKQLQAESKQLQDEVQQLRAEMTDVKNVQGYIVWEKDWRNEKDAP